MKAAHLCFAIFLFVVTSDVALASELSDRHSKAKSDMQQRYLAWKSLLQEQKEKRNHLESEIEKQRTDFEGSKTVI